MPVSQRFIDLLNAPLPVLRAVAARHDIGVARGNTKWELAQRLAQLPHGAEDETDEFLYAGSTSLSWLRFVLLDEPYDIEDADTFYPIRGVELSSDAVRGALHVDSEGDPFSENDRPTEITSTPKLVVAREWDEEDGYILTFALARRTGHVIHNFEQHDVLEDEFFNALIRPFAGSFEVRASAARVQRLANTWLTSFAETLGCRALPVAITHQDWHDLHDELAARLDTFTGKTITGTTVFDTRAYTKADAVDDLLGEQEFQYETQDLEPISLDLVFDDPQLSEVRLYVSVLNGSIFIRTAVPERVIRYVREVVERIKERRLAGP